MEGLTPLQKLIICIFYDESVNLSMQQNIGDFFSKNGKKKDLKRDLFTFIIEPLDFQLFYHFFLSQFLVALELICAHPQ